jgi:hypothetical protein
MLGEQELTQVRNYLIEILPELLRSEPAIATTIEGILAQHFPRRDEFARLLEELRDFRQETNQRFEQVDHHLDGLEKGQLAIRRDVAKLQSGQDYLLRRLDGMEAWMQLLTGQLRNEKGRAMEEIVALGLRYGLGQPDIKAENIRLNQRLVDKDASVYPVPSETEVDLVATNGELLVFEVKSSGKMGEVTAFQVKLRLLSVQNPDKRVRGVFIAPEPGDDVRRLCVQYGIELVEAAARSSPP